MIALPALCGCVRPAAQPAWRRYRDFDAYQSSRTGKVPRQTGSARTPVPAGSAVVAIVIDDCGESPEQVIPFLGIPVPLSFGVLLAFRINEYVPAHFGSWIRDAGPCPWNRTTRGGWKTTGSDNRDGSRADPIRIDRALDGVPCATGMNNHMGSRFTADAPGMDHVMSRLKERGIYFLDSRTSDQSPRSPRVQDRTRCLSRTCS